MARFFTVQVMVPLASPIDHIPGSPSNSVSRTSSVAASISVNSSLASDRKQKALNEELSLVKISGFGEMVGYSKFHYRG